MVKKITILAAAILAASLCLCQAALGESAGTASQAGYDGISKAISDIEMSFVQPGKIRGIKVKEGELVRVGDILMQQADEVEVAQLQVLESKATNKLPIRLAQVDLLQKKKDLETMRSAGEKGAVTSWEIDHAVLAVDTARLTLKLREFEHEQDVLKLATVTESIKRLTLTSPLAGIVEKISVEPGETVQALMPVIRIVRINPLRIDLPVPVAAAKALRSGRRAQVRFTDGEELAGEIVKIASIADAAATTLEVTLEVRNPKERPAGERVTVKFPDPNE